MAKAKLTPREAWQILIETGGDVGTNYFALRRDVVSNLLDAARKYGYRGTSTRGRSRANMFYDHLHNLAGKLTAEQLEAGYKTRVTGAKNPRDMTAQYAVEMALEKGATQQDIEEETTRQRRHVGTVPFRNMVKALAMTSFHNDVDDWTRLAGALLAMKTKRVTGSRNPKRKRAAKKRAKTMRHRIKATGAKNPVRKTRRRKRKIIPQGYEYQFNKSGTLKAKYRKQISAPKRAKRRLPKWYVFTLKNGVKYYATGPSHREAFDTDKRKAKPYLTKAHAEIIGRTIAAATPHAVQIGICT